MNVRNLIVNAVNYYLTFHCACVLSVDPDDAGSSRCKMRSSFFLSSSTSFRIVASLDCQNGQHCPAKPPSKRRTCRVFGNTLISSSNGTLLIIPSSSSTCGSRAWAGKSEPAVRRMQHPVTHLR